MEFKITPEEALEMARFEEEAGCEIGAGVDGDAELVKLMELMLGRADREKWVALLSDQVGHILSVEEIEEAATSLQVQIQERIAGKVATQKSA